MRQITVTVNGRPYTRAVEPRLLLSDFLRHDLGLTGTHVGCEHGACGACTVLVDGEPVRSCLTLAVQMDGHAITTVEGLGSPERLHPLQEAFHEEHGLQCGFCTPGFVMTLARWLPEHPQPTETAIREALSGNLCRCTGYQNIVKAVRRAGEESPAANGADGGVNGTAGRVNGTAGRVNGENGGVNGTGGGGGPTFGRPVRRSEDRRLLTGAGLFVDDVRRPGMLHGAVVRSPYAHARILAIDTSRAAALPGVALVLTAADLGRFNGPLPLLIPHDDLQHGRTQVALAADKVRHVGEPVAFVVAESRYIAEDGAELVEVTFEPLPVAADLERAAEPDSPRVHDDMDGNVGGHYARQVGDYEAARAQAALLLHERFHVDRGTAAPMETRGVVALPEESGLTLYVSTQAPVALRAGLAAWFGLPEMQLRLIAPDVGGGFGPKVMMFYPEEVLVPFAAMKLKRPVKWIEDRREHFVATTQEREQIHEVEAAVSADGLLLGLRDRILHDSGAYTPYGIQVPIITVTTLPGPYRLRNYDVAFRAVYTNKPSVTPYRGAGRPQGVFAMERIMDRIAEATGLDPLEVRRRNFIQPDEFPWDTGLIYQDWAPCKYDSGNYPELADRLERLLDLDRVRREQAEARAAGRYVGVGIGFYVEGAGPGPYEGARVRVEPSGKVQVATGVGTQGQGHFTAFAQIVADQLGVAVGDVYVTTGDTAAMGWGIGTFASRAGVVVGNAAHLAAGAVADKARKVAATLLACDPAEVELMGGRAHVAGHPERSLALGEVAKAANPLRGTLAFGEPGLEATRFFSPQQSTFPSGCHGAVVEVDPATGFIRFLRYCVVHDCGKMINPMIVEGQVHGGVAQGLGGTFFEKLVYDEHGQLLTTTFADYLLPTASDLPKLELDHLETESPLNPLGVKGAGEAGVIPCAAVVAAAVEDALRPLGVRITEMPLSPSRLHELISGARFRV